ncbi:NAD(P)/FAD-dependent oxidoreductase [Pseudotabrizicola alkalilacus]|uniref:FAD-binding oxidoreductase n=1 Tax=Pseudotabrizicola alkalilacus TaxID=2305252 RepID=A0A411YYU1_9RHOB|nr:FAD-binding oxidoreductase [Pseudotabrizicola alkalilacus]RGP35909.1 FAD-binding oxidoreductase [Pseudotabrizicola alkalilacus]
MAPVITPVKTDLDIPASTSVVVIGGGIVGLTAALNLAERGIPVVVLEKGRIAGEQSSRNLGWIRKTGRSLSDLPLSVESDRLWAGMAERVGADVGYRQAGIMYVARTEAEMEKHATWIGSAGGQSLDSRLLSPGMIDALVPGGTGGWIGGIYTPSDGRAEPTLASSAIAAAAIVKGAVIVENCAVRTLVTAAGRVSGVMTERGEIACEQVLLAGGLWSRRFLGNHGVVLPTLPLVASVFRTGVMEGPTDIAVGAADFSFRKRHDGGYTITQRGALFAPLMLDHLLIGHRYLPVLKAEWKNVRLSFGRDFLRDLSMARHWSGTARSPLEQLRTMDPAVNHGLNAEAMQNLCKAWPVFNGAAVRQSWAGMIDVTPDSLPVISPVAKLPGLTLASGFSGHGFGTAPAAGQLAVDLLTGSAPIVDPTPYRLERL